MGRRKKVAKVVVAESSVTAWQMSDFWRMVADGTVDGLMFEGFLVDPRRFASAITTLPRALRILGADKVVTAGQAAKAWGVTVPQNAVSRYSEQAFCDAAAENAAGTADWRLVCILGLWSLRELRRTLGTDPQSQPCIYNSDWWLTEKDDSWATRRAQSGYLLLEFKGKWGCTTWADQEMQIRASGLAFERADEVAVTEAALTIHKVHGVYLLQAVHYETPHHTIKSATIQRAPVRVLFVAYL